MEDLKRRVKNLVTEDRHPQLDKIFNEWVAGLKIHLTSNPDGAEEGCGSESPGNSREMPLKAHLEDLRRQIVSFKEKIKEYKESSTTESALLGVKNEIEKVRVGISKLRAKFSNLEEEAKGPENEELVKKLDEVNEFLEKLQ